MSKPGFDKNGLPLNAPAARREINRIRGDRGHIDDYDEDQIRKTDDDFQEDYRRRALIHREVYARYTKTVAEQLYSSRFRLIYELLQNGDDACYTENVEPTITFRVKPTELIIESNEQGFSLKDVESICDTGKSSKIGNSDTTGEKGLGFKAVFGIADYVHIQSGLWSFRFEHKRGEDGVGMITPIWTDVVSSLPSNVGTRCTLRYSDSRDSFHKRLISEFEKLPKTIIFALRQLRRLIVVVESDDGRSAGITFTKDGDLNSDEIHINTIVTGQFGDHLSDTTRLRLFQETVIDLPFESQRTDATSDVTIAFEVDSNGLPVIPTRGQHVFAYLPVQRVPQLPFLIHANFVLAANREAVPDIDWNQALREGIVSAFVGLVIELVTPGDPLEFKWMRYLPGKTMEGFWEDLYDDITYELLGKAILRSRRGRLHDLNHMKVLPPWFFHELRPLLPDTDDDIYLSGSYEPFDMKTLKELGLKQISSTQIVTRINLCLSAKAERCIYNRPLDDPWHTAFAALIQRLLQVNIVKTEIQRLDIIPLSNNTWVSPLSFSPLYSSSIPVYFPYIIDEDSVRIEVPDGLGLRKLHPMAAADGERVNFYMSLGIASCPHDTVAQKILEAHKSREGRGNVFAYMRDLEILFWFGKPTSQSRLSHADLLLVSDQNVLHQGLALFFPSKEEYHSEKRLAATPKKDFSNYGILDPRYMESQVRKHIRHDIDWISWLQKCGVSYFPPLTKSVFSRYTLNPLMVLIARDNPKSFVANLREHWSDYRLGAARITKDLKLVSVPCQNGSTKQLSETILPTQQLIEKSKELNMDEILPFLKLPSDYDIQNSEAWFFLKDFGVICEPNASFYLTAVRLLNVSAKTQLIPVCTRIYAGITQTTTVGDTSALQQAFSNQPLIRTLTTAEAWCKSTDCIWEGPIFLRAKRVLSPVYAADPNASSFFKTILSMRNVEHGDLIDELKILASEGHEVSPSFGDELQEIYTVLADMARSDSMIEAVREEFNTRGLIFVSGRWLKPAECLWNCTVAISGRVPLDQVYPKLKKFFVDKMKVMTMNINVLIQELARTAKAMTAPDFEEIKRIMLAIGQLLAADPNVNVNAEFLKALKKTAFLPVHCPDDVRLFSINQHFFVNDHKRYGEIFKNKARIVDFGHEEMSLLHPFFELLGIQHRYLSNQVSSNTTVHKSTPNHPLRDCVRDRAYAFSCCANAYNSPKYYNRNTSMHQLLLITEVFVCEEMWTELTVRQEDEEISARSDRAVVKISQEDGTLALYVPSDRDGLYSCFNTELPGALARLLDIQNRAAVKVIYRIMNDVKKDLDTIMKDEDLCDYPWFERPVSSQQPSPFPAPNGTEDPPIDSISSSSTIADEALPVFLTDQSSNASYPEVANSFPSPISVRPTAQDSVWEQVARTEQYKKFLKEVVRQASRGQPLRSGSLSLFEIDEALNELDNTVDYAGFHRAFGGTGNGNFEHNARIGAAGELFVFELLKSSGVSNFTIDNWQSSIRHYVSILPEYQDEPTWIGREISDIMYKGNCPRLVDILRQNTTFPYPAWLESAMTSTAVHYHIEVKATSGPCSTPFFMSGNQYKLMREKQCEPHSPTAPKDLFVIMRVFNLFSRNIGLQVYINPWHLRETALDFVADPWKVIPCETLLVH